MNSQLKDFYSLLNEAVLTIEDFTEDHFKQTGGRVMRKRPTNTVLDSQV